MVNMTEGERRYIAPVLQRKPALTGHDQSHGRLLPSTRSATPEIKNLSQLENFGGYGGEGAEDRQRPCE